MRDDLLERPAVEFFEELIIKHISQILPGGKRWLRMHELEKLLDVPRQEIIQLVEEGEIMISYLGDCEIFDYKEICEVLEGAKCLLVTPKLREKFD